jgi:pentatricopeptide repeat protein
MSAFLRIRHFDQVLDIFEGLVDDGFEPDAMIFDLVLMTYIKMNDIESASRVLETWEDMSAGEPRSGDAYWRESIGARERMNRKTRGYWRGVYGGEILDGDIFETTDIYGRTYNTPVDCSKFLGLDSGVDSDPYQSDTIDESNNGEMPKLSLPKPEPQSFLKQTGDPARRKKRMIRYTMKGLKEEEAKPILDQGVLEISSQKFMFIPAFTFEQFISASVKVGRKESAIAIITEMIVRGLKPTRKCFKSIIGILAESWDTRAYDFYIAMLEYGFMPNEGDSITDKIFKMIERNLDELGLIRFLQVLLGQFTCLIE